MRIQLVLLLVGWISAWTYYYVCWHQGHCHGINASRMEAALRAETLPNLRIVGEDLEVEANQNIRYARSEAVPVVPEATQNALTAAKNYFNAHKDEGLVITGFFDETEANTTLLSNLGLARAEAFKAWLSDFGVDRQQIVTDFRESINLTFQKDTLVDGLLFEVTDDLPEEEMDDDELADLEEKLRVASPDLYFETGATTLQVTEELRQYILNLRKYLNVKQDASIMLIGHTDNVGDAEGNLEYGQQRADFTRDILSSIGISRSQVKTSSQGESAPIATNDTEEGRSKNRRVQIKLN